MRDPARALDPTSFTGFSPTRSVGRVGEDPGNEVTLDLLAGQKYNIYHGLCVTAHSPDKGKGCSYVYKATPLEIRMQVIISGTYWSDSPFG